MSFNIYGTDALKEPQSNSLNPVTNLGDLSTLGGPGNFGGSGKSFSELSAGKGASAILGLFGIGAADWG